MVLNVAEDLQPLGLAYQAFIRVGGRYFARYPVYVRGPNTGIGPILDSFKARVMNSSEWHHRRDVSRAVFE